MHTDEFYTEFVTFCHFVGSKIRKYDIPRPEITHSQTFDSKQLQPEAAKSVPASYLPDGFCVTFPRGGDH